MTRHPRRVPSGNLRSRREPLCRQSGSDGVCRTGSQRVTFRPGEERVAETRRLFASAAYFRCDASRRGNQARLANSFHRHEAVTEAGTEPCYRSPKAIVWRPGSGESSFPRHRAPRLREPTPARRGLGAARSSQTFSSRSPPGEPVTVGSMQHLIAQADLDKDQQARERLADAAVSRLP